MTLPTRPDREQTCAQTRRRQILDAAAVGFVRHGFHGASIAMISKMAGMSPGHIYHFFENKEAIIAALVERKLQQSLALMRQLDHAEDVFQSMLDQVDLGVNQKTDLDHAALEIEILAEATRNPQVAAMVQAADAAMHEQVQRLMRQARLACGLSGEVDPAAIEIVRALFEGLAVRAINNPDLDKKALLPMLRVALRALIA